MPIESVQYLKPVIEFIINYAVTKGLDQIGGRTQNTSTEMTVYEHACCLLTESLQEFCGQEEIEFDESSFVETLVLSKDQVDLLNKDEYLKLALEKAIFMELSDEDWERWVGIVNENLLSSKHEKLFRAILLKQIKGDITNLVEPKWMQSIMMDNFFQIAFEEEKKLAEIFADIKTGLSQACWRYTQELVMELLYNAVQHGGAKRLSFSINEDSITLIDDGKAYNTLSLVESDGHQGGGSWTIKHYIDNYPDVKLYYERVNEKNKFSLRFAEKMFNVKRLCEIELYREEWSRCLECRLRYPESKARYYYIDFSKSEIAKSLFCMSLACNAMRSVKDFCNALGSDVYIYVPDDGSFGWDDVAGKLDYLINELESENIHIVRD